MFRKHETFDLNKKRNEHKRDKLNHPKKFKHFKYFIIPAIVAFSLLCILMNVKFTKNDPHTKIKMENVVNFSKTSSFNRNSSIQLTLANMTNVLYGNESSSYEVQSPLKLRSLQNRQTEFTANLIGAISCQEFKANCTLICKNGNVNFMEENLNDLQEKCRNVDLNLIIENCEFTNGVLQQSFFFGFFSLGYLSITKCNLQSIKAQAFKNKNVYNLKTLIFRENLLTTLESTTFEDLSLLENFEFLQLPLAGGFKGDLFLKPLAYQLNVAVLQPCINDSVAMDPLKWWQGLLMNRLTKLDLSNTNLQNNLSEKAFLNFKVLEYLVLFNCNLFTIEGEIFDMISNTLKYLDLRLNYLKTLDLVFLKKLVALGNVEIDLTLNDWNCECDAEMLLFFKDQDCKISEDMICSTPKKWEQIALSQVIKECKESEITSDTDTTTDITIALDNSTLWEGDISTFSPETTTLNSNTTTTASTKSSEPTTTPSSSESSTTLTLTTIRSSSSKTTESSTDNPLDTSTSTTTISSSSIATESSAENPFTTISSSSKSSESSTENPFGTTSSSSIATESSTVKQFNTSTTTTTTKIPYIPPNLIAIQCKINQNTEKVSLNILQPKANFSILTTSPSSVTINVQATSYMEKFSFIYFNNQTDYQNVFETPNFKMKSVLVKINVKNLTISTSYVFCFIEESTLKVSPFDCKAHFMEEFCLNKTKWLSKPDKIWFFAITSIIALILFFLSLLLVYCLLRYNPHWIISRNKRILQVHNDPKKVLILSRKFSGGSTRSSGYLKSLPSTANKQTEESIYSSQLSVPKARAPNKPITTIYSETCEMTNLTGGSSPECSRTSKYLQALPPLSHPTTEDIGNSLYSSSLKVPNCKAPIKPMSPLHAQMNRKCHKSSCSPVSRFRRSQKIYPKNMDYLDIIENEPEYQTIDYYEVINF